MRPANSATPSIVRYVPLPENMSANSRLTVGGLEERVEPHQIYHSYELIDGEHLRVATTWPANAYPVPLLIFNGVGASLDIVEPLMRSMTGFRVITFDLPGIGGSDTSWNIRRMSGFANLAARLLDKLGVNNVFVMGVSWGGGLAQQFALDYQNRCEKLVLAATSTGHIMVPPSLRVMLHMATPLRYLSAGYFKRIAGTIYGGDFRSDERLRDRYARLMSPPSLIGYLNQLYAVTGWTSAFRAHRIRQPVLIMAGEDDPIVTMPNARLLNALIPDSRVKVFDCGHLFILTRLSACVAAVEEFLAVDHTKLHKKREDDGTVAY